MSLLKFVQEIELSKIDCGKCGGTYAINERYRLQRYQEGGSWTCPYCKCGWGYSGKGENEQLKKQLESERRSREFYQKNSQAEREARERTERRLIATRSAKTRLKNRIKNGVCPCCTRTFQNLAAHMKTQHPEFTGADEETIETKTN